MTTIPADTIKDSVIEVEVEDVTSVGEDVMEIEAEELEVDITGLHFTTAPSPHTCHSTEFDRRYLNDLFAATHRSGMKDEDAKRAKRRSQEFTSLGVSSKCSHCTDRYLLLAEALDYHHAMLTSGKDHRRAAHYACQRSEVLAKLGFTTV